MLKMSTSSLKCFIDGWGTLTLSQMRFHCSVSIAFGLTDLSLSVPLMICVDVKLRHQNFWIFIGSVLI